MGVALLVAQTMLCIVSWRHSGLPVVLMSTILIDSYLHLYIYYGLGEQAVEHLFPGLKLLLCLFVRDAL